jgi:hypothetical protein
LLSIFSSRSRRWRSASFSCSIASMALLLLFGGAGAQALGGGEGDAAFVDGADGFVGVAEVRLFYRRDDPRMIEAARPIRFPSSDAILPRIGETAKQVRRTRRRFL